MYLQRFFFSFFFFFLLYQSELSVSHMIRFVSDDTVKIIDYYIIIGTPDSFHNFCTEFAFITDKSKVLSTTTVDTILSLDLFSTNYIYGVPRILTVKKTKITNFFDAPKYFSAIIIQSLCFKEAPIKPATFWGLFCISVSTD